MDINLQQASIALIGRLGRLPRRRLALAFQQFAITPTRRLTRASTITVINHGALAWLRDGRLDAVLAQADARRLPVISEHGLLRRLGLLPALAPEARSHDLRALASHTALAPRTARLLALFDIVEDDRGFYGFRDLKATRDFARNLATAGDLIAALELALAARRRHDFRRHMAEMPLIFAADQIPLDLGAVPVDFDAARSLAHEALAQQDYSAAEQAFRLCAGMRPRDAHTLRDLADCIAERDRPKEARALLQRALALQPDFADAWVSMAQLESGSAMRVCLERALASDPDHAAALHDLAQLHMAEERYDEALPLWQRYLDRAEQSPAPIADRAAIERARRALTLCRMARLRRKTNDHPTG